MNAGTTSGSCSWFLLRKPQFNDDILRSDDTGVNPRRDVAPKAGRDDPLDRCGELARGGVPCLVESLQARGSLDGTRAPEGRLVGRRDEAAAKVCHFFPIPCSAFFWPFLLSFLSSL